MILHVDMNAYFATMEQQANPFLRSRPILVCGKGSGERTVVATASYEAKNRGVKTGMAAWEAKKLVPEALIVAADYDKYLDVTRRLGVIFEHYTPDVEFFSIDEAFLDVPNNLAAAITCAEQIKQDIKRELGNWVTCSIGIAEKKLLAKIASEFKKPDGLTVIAPTFLTQTELYQTINLDDIPGIGPRILLRLLQLGITSPNVLGQTPLPILIKEFGNHEGQLLYNLGRGIDPSPVARNELMPEEQSFSHSYTLPKEIYTYEASRTVLLELCEMVGRRMRKKGFAAKTIGVFMRFTDMTTVSNRKTLKEYTNDGLNIFRIGERLLQKTWAFRPPVHTPGVCKPVKPIRQVGVWVTNLIHERNVPLPLFPQDRRYLKSLKTMDQINDKYGEHAIMRGPILEVYKKIQKIPDGRNKRQFGL